jgi:hypothetical protein
MNAPKKRSLLPAPVAVFIVAHLAALSLAWALASLVSRQHADLSPQGLHIRLVPLSASR